MEMPVIFRQMTVNIELAGRNRVYNFVPTTCIYNNNLLLYCYMTLPSQSLFIEDSHSLTFSQRMQNFFRENVRWVSSLHGIVGSMDEFLLFERNRQPLIWLNLFLFSNGMRHEARGIVCALRMPVEKQRWCCNAIRTIIIHRCNLGDGRPVFSFAFFWKRAAHHMVHGRSTSVAPK